MNKSVWQDDQAQCDEIVKLWDKPWGDRRQEIVVIGQSMDSDAITMKFDGCLLTDDEMAMGPEAWMTHFKDPFFEWQVAMEEDAPTEEEKTMIQH